MSVTRRIASKRRPGLGERLRESFDRALDAGVDLAENLAARLLTRADPLAEHMTGDERRALALERVAEGALGRSLGRATALVVLGGRSAEGNPRLLFLPVSSRSIAGATGCSSPSAPGGGAGAAREDCSGAWSSSAARAAGAAGRPSRTASRRYWPTTEKWREGRLL